MNNLPILILSVESGGRQKTTKVRTDSSTLGRINTNAKKATRLKVEVQHHTLSITVQIAEEDTLFCRLIPVIILLPTSFPYSFLLL